jgi:hypothetical protein
MSVIITIIASCLSVIVIVLGFVYKTSRWVTKQEEENKDIRSDTAHKIEKAKSDCMHCIDLEKEKMTAMKERIDRHDTAIETVTKATTEMTLLVNNINTSMRAEFKSIGEKIDEMKKYIEEQRNYDRRKTSKTSND